MDLELCHHVGVEKPRRIVLVKVFNNLIPMRACCERTQHIIKRRTVAANALNKQIQPQSALVAPHAIQSMQGGIQLPRLRPWCLSELALPALSDKAVQSLLLSPSHYIVFPRTLDRSLIPYTFANSDELLPHMSKNARALCGLHLCVGKLPLQIPVECANCRASKTLGHGTKAGRTRPACRGRPAAAAAPLPKPLDTDGVGVAIPLSSIECCRRQHKGNER